MTQTAMKVEVEKVDQYVAKIKLEIPADQASTEYNKAWRRLGQRVNIPGFRRGKAPRNMVEKTVGVDRIKQEAMDRLLPHVFADAISEHQLDIVAPPQIESFQFELTNGIQISASVELRPEAKLPDLSNIKVDVPQFKMPADAEEREIKTLVDRFSTLEPVISRPVQATDVVNIDFDGAINGEKIRGGAAKNFRLDMSNNNFIDGFADQLVGHSLSEEFTINVSFPKDYHDANLAGKPAEFKIKINEINERKTPELTDEFAAKVGPYTTIAELKADIQKTLKDAEENENTFRKQKAVIDHLVEKAEVEVPESMVSRESRLLMEEVQQRLRSQGIPWEKFLDAQGHDATWESLRSEAVKRIKTSLVFGAIAKQGDFAVSEEEFTAQVKELAQMRGVDEKNIMRHLGNNFEAAQALSDQLLSQKIVDHLCTTASFNFVPEEQLEAKEKEAAAKADKKGKKEEPAAVGAAAAVTGEEVDVLDSEA